MPEFYCYISHLPNSYKGNVLKIFFTLTFLEIVNGSSVLPENMMKKLDTFPDFEMVTGAKVTKVVDNNNR